MKRTRQPENLAHVLGRVQTGRGLAAGDWDVLGAAVLDAVRRVVPARDAGDLVGEVFLKVRRARLPFRGDSEVAALAYLRTVARRAWLDQVRKQGRRTRRLALPEGDDGVDPLERVAAPEADPTLDPDAQARLEAARDTLRAHVDGLLEEEPRAQVRQVRFLQAQACILAVLDKQGADGIREALGVSPSNAVIYKWTERGRPVVLAALERWAAAELDEWDARAVAYLRELFAARRADAGAARPARRGAAPRSRAVSRRASGSSVQYVARKKPTSKRGGAP